ncbi:MAG TPA: FAD-dependent monooxygenase [Bryobacteraceae bacterium]|nr:FAD-dependent monooxygenase [Bryobacteraceae bacterium]
MAFHVLVIGGGIGGLCLAQGLKKTGISVAVYERDRTRTDRLQGYRIHIDPEGSRALHHCLPRENFDAFVATCGKPGKGLRIMTDQLQELMFIGSESPQDSIARDRSASRITLRQVLLAGLEDVIHFDKHFSRYEEGPDDRVTAHFEDGTSASGDVLVAADGVNSRIRQQLLPHARLVDTHVTGIAAKAHLLPAFNRLEGANAIQGGRGDGMFIARQEFQNPPQMLPKGIGGNDRAASIPPGFLFDNTQSYIFWAYITRREKCPVAIDDTLAPDTLLDIVAQRTAGWHAELRELIQQSDPATIAVWNIRTSVPVEHWRTTNITLLGDAIHSMTPARGIGANIALRDADLLRRKLAAAHEGNAPLLQAIEEYELEMIAYGFQAVRESAQALQMFVAEKAA